MSFTGGYIFKNFEGAAEPALRNFPISDSVPVFPLGGHQREPWRLERDELLRVFRESGCGDLFPVPENAGTVRHIIVGAVHNGPLDQAWTPEMFPDPGLFVSGLRILAALFPDAALAVAINRRHKRWFEPRVPGDLAAMRVMSGRYPQELPEFLIRDIVESREERTVSLTVTFEDTFQLAESLCLGKNLTDRIILAAGPGVSRPGWWRIPMETSFREIRQHLLKSEKHGSWRVIRGNPFTGSAVFSDDETISGRDCEITVIREHTVRDFQRFLNPGFDYDSYSRLTVSAFVPFLGRRLDSNTHGGTRPCVQCNFCDEVCPAGLYPHFIWKHVNAGMIDECARLRPERCAGCGLCDYVCPSKIDISAAVRKAGDTRKAEGV